MKFAVSCFKNINFALCWRQSIRCGRKKKIFIFLRDNLEINFFIIVGPFLVRILSYDCFHGNGHKACLFWLQCPGVQLVWAERARKRGKKHGRSTARESFLSPCFSHIFPAFFVLAAPTN